MNALAGLLEGIVAHPLEEDRYHVLADWLEEHDDPHRAELLRLHRQLLASCTTPELPQRTGWQARLVRLLEQGVRPCLPQRTTTLPGGASITFSFLPPGTFLMGSPPSEKDREEDETQHRVTLTKGFFLAVTSVTQAQWVALMGSNPSSIKGADRPVERVSWKDCQEFCERLSQQDGKAYRLPTEAEWEYACRAGTTTPFSFGETITADQANCRCGNGPSHTGRQGLSRKQTTSVGSFPANAWGLFDMHGNVWEWCQDWYGLYPSSDTTDPQGQNSAKSRVLRGGSWDYVAEDCRAACRNGLAPSGRSNSYGFRLCFPVD